VSDANHRLLLAVVKGHRRLEAVLEGFVEFDLPGATVLDARGMGQIVATEIPVFSGFRSLFQGGGEESYMILSVLTEPQIREAMALIQDIYGGSESQGSGIVAVLPVLEFLGPPARD
jgi:nitrogen regulatory protein P-II 1